jgi:hypothetical protein
MKFLLFVFTILSLILQSCEPPRDCTNPNCVTSSILVKLKANLSNENKVLHVGDTLKMSLHIPDTLATNEGTYYVRSVQKATFALHYYHVDTIVSDTNFTINNEDFLIKKGKMAYQSTALELDNSLKELELDFVMSKKGHFYIQISPQSGRLEMTEKDGTKYLIMFNTGFNVKDNHLDLYLSWIGNVSDRNKAQAKVTDSTNAGFGWYSFNVE